MGEHADYSLVVYLNQAVVFDLLAIMEDGMAQVSTIRTSESKKAGTEAGIGGSNVFALLGVRLKGGLESTEGQEAGDSRTGAYSHVALLQGSRTPQEGEACSRLRDNLVG